MQIKLKKYFMIFLGATLVSTSGKRERNTLTTSREMPAYEDVANPLLCPKELEHTVVFCQSCSTNTAHI